MYECLNVLNNFCFHVYAQNLLSHFLTLTLSHSHTLSISHSITLDMLNNFCFHLYAQKSLFLAKIAMVFFDSLNITLSCYFGVHRAGSQLKIRSLACSEAELLHEELHHLLGTRHLVFGLHVDVSKKSFQEHS